MARTSPAVAVKLRSEEDTRCCIFSKIRMQLSSAAFAVCKDNKTVSTNAPAVLKYRDFFTYAFCFKNQLEAVFII